MGNSKKKYSNEFKLKVVLESMQRDTTIEKVKKQFGIGHTQIHRWKQILKDKGSSIYETSKKSKSDNDSSDTIEQLKIAIGELTMENQLLKKALKVI